MRTIAQVGKVYEYDSFPVDCVFRVQFALRNTEIVYVALNCLICVLHVQAVLLLFVQPFRLDIDSPRSIERYPL